MVVVVTHQAAGAGCGLRGAPGEWEPVAHESDRVSGGSFLRGLASAHPAHTPTPAPDTTCHRSLSFPRQVLRAVYAYFMGVPSEDIPCLDIPLHTLIELNPMPDGTMSERRFPVDIDSAPALPLLPGERAAAAATRVGIKSAMAHAGLSPQGSFNASSSQCGAAAAVGLKGEAGADGSTQPVSPASGTPETNSAEAAAGAVAGVGAAAGVEASSGALVAEAVVAGA